MSKRTDLQGWLETHAAEIGEKEFAAIRAALAPITDSYLRKLLRDSGAPLAPLIAGVRQSNFEELEASLLTLLDEYERAPSTTKSTIRALVITAKDRAKWVSKTPAHASNKQEMILWMVTWLENPAVFRTWLTLRKREITR